MNEALEEGLRHKLAAERAEEFVERMGRSFGALTEEELLMVNRVYLAGKNCIRKDRSYSTPARRANRPAQPDDTVAS